MSNLVDHAKIELAKIGLSEHAPDEMNRHMYGDLMTIINIFAGQGHSGGSAGYAIGVLSKLLNYEPLAPLTGDDDEWMDVTETIGRKAWMNKRCSRIIKEEDGKCYDLEGRVFRDPDGSTWTNRDSWVEITFPYTPKHEFVDRTQEEADAA